MAGADARVPVMLEDAAADCASRGRAMRLGPPRTVAGQLHQCILLKVVSRDANGRPKDVVALYADDVEHLKGGEEYVSAYVTYDVRERLRKN